MVLECGVDGVCWRVGCKKQATHKKYLALVRRRLLRGEVGVGVESHPLTVRLPLLGQFQGGFGQRVRDWLACTWVKERREAGMWKTISKQWKSELRHRKTAPTSLSLASQRQAVLVDSLRGAVQLGLSVSHDACARACGPIPGEEILGVARLAARHSSYGHMADRDPIATYICNGCVQCRKPCN